MEDVTVAAEEIVGRKLWVYAGLIGYVALMVGYWIGIFVGGRQAKGTLLAQLERL